ncbi:hypothetical protein ACP4OV_007823 [Aristida adscensionis]
MADVEAEADSSAMHIDVFPWLAFGHLLPFLELAERLAARGHHVSFVNTPRNLELLRELAHGLELAGARFLWALRPPVGVREDSILPDGFAARTGGRGLVTARWAPQVRVLAHAAVGAFLTHCGWGSVVEALRFGRPLVMLPILGDQGPNARLMKARGVGVAVPRDERDGSFDRLGVAGAVRAVAAEDGGRVFAANARKLQEVVADVECHERCIDGFVQHLRSCR